MGFSILKTRAAQETLGRLLAGYLRLVQRTNRIVFEPADIYDHVRPELPLIFAMWHGQHIMIPFARPDWMPACSLVSRHGDGGFNAVAVPELGLRASPREPPQTVRRTGQFSANGASRPTT